MSHNFHFGITTITPLITLVILVTSTQHAVSLRLAKRPSAAKTTACKIGRRTMMRKDKSARQETVEAVEWQWWMRQRWRQRKTAAADNNSNGGGWRRWTTAADKDGLQDWVAEYSREGWERANNDGFTHKGWWRGCCFWRGSYGTIYVVNRTISCFWQGSYNFFCGGFANKREKCTYDSEYYLCREKTTKNTLNITFLGENVLVSLYVCMLSFAEIQHWLYFQNQRGNVWVLYYPVYNRVCREVE